MRRVLLTDDFPPVSGGVATWCAHMARGLAERGERVDVLCRYRPGQEGRGYAVHGIRGPSFRNWGAVYALASLPLMRAADRVLVCDARQARHALRFLPADRVDLVFHGSDATAALPGRARLVGRRFAVSRYLAARLADDGVPVIVVPPPIDVTATPSTRSGPWVLVARATPLKGGDRFVRLIAAAGVDGLVVGDGPALANWRALALAIGARVRFVGAVDRAGVAELLQTASLAVLLPRDGPDGRGNEAFGLSLVEAAAAGVPVVGCRTGGVPEAVGPGLLLDDPDDARASADAVWAWLDGTRGGAARQWVQSTCGVARALAALDDP